MLLDKIEYTMWAIKGRILHFDLRTDHLFTRCMECNDTGDVTKKEILNRYFLKHTAKLSEFKNVMTVTGFTGTAHIPEYEKTY